MPDIILPDTSCLIFLEKINEIDLLPKIYSKIIVTKEIEEEYISPLPEWIKIKTSEMDRYQKVLEQTIDRGEASIIVLAMGMKDCIVSIDDLKARKLARNLDLNLTGTLGILYKAKNAGHIESIREKIEMLKRVDFRISENIEQEILRLSGE